MPRLKIKEKYDNGIKSFKEENKELRGENMELEGRLVKVEHKVDELEDHGKAISSYMVHQRLVADWKCGNKVNPQRYVQ